MALCLNGAGDTEEETLEGLKLYGRVYTGHSPRSNAELVFLI